MLAARTRFVLSAEKVFPAWPVPPISYRLVVNNTFSAAAHDVECVNVCYITTNVMRVGLTAVKKT
jgi:hypothetical protein